MFQIRIVVKLGGPVGELGLFHQDLADLCEIQPKLAGEWISGVIERLSLVDLGKIMTELELFNLEVMTIGMCIISLVMAICANHRITRPHTIIGRRKDT